MDCRGEGLGFSLLPADVELDDRSPLGRPQVHTDLDLRNDGGFTGIPGIESACEGEVVAPNGQHRVIARIFDTDSAIRKCVVIAARIARAVESDAVTWLTAGAAVRTSRGSRGRWWRPRPSCPRSAGKRCAGSAGRIPAGRRSCLRCGAGWG